MSFHWQPTGREAVMCENKLIDTEKDNRNPTLGAPARKYIDSISLVLFTVLAGA